MGYRVFVPCAGSGTRLGDLTRFLNKSLVSIANRPTLSHIVERFPDDTEFVIALGHKGNLVKQFLELAYPERKFYFSYVTPFEGPGSGLGLSLLSCKDYLQQPFIFISCDTLVDEKIPPPDCNWMGYSDISEASDISSYRTIRLSGQLVEEISEKGDGCSDIHHPYIGLSGIHDYAEFWKAMEGGDEQSIEVGEAFGLRHIINKRNIYGHKFTWHDTGCLGALEKARERYREPNEPNILDKANEAIWFVGSHVIKFSDDSIFIKNRVERAAYLKGFVPPVEDFRSNMYSYEKVDGAVLSEVVSTILFEKFLDHCKSFWTPKEITAEERTLFNRRCLNFYRDKTFERIDLFYRLSDKSDGCESINGRSMPKLSLLLENIDWKWLSAGLPGRFHGDFHFENIIWNKANDRFHFLDWRQDFSGDLEVGDIYYDLAKLLHGLIVNHGVVAKKQYSANWDRAEIKFNFSRLESLVECEHRLDEWIVASGYDLKKVRILTSLIYLNIAALHHHPYSIMLYGLGKSMLLDLIDK